MGGLAIKQVIGQEGDRISPSMKNRIMKSINKINLFPIQSPVEIREKIDFGDIDFIIPNTVDYDVFEKEILRVMCSDGFVYQGNHKNGCTTSFAFNNHQLDFNRVKDMKLSMFYYSNNDFGNLLGRIANFLGLKLGHEKFSVTPQEGITIELKRSEEYDVQDILTTLGFSKDDINFIEKKVYKGFDTYIEMFETVTRSNYFNGPSYLFENLNQANRIRNKKRSTYNAFVEFLINSELIKKQPEDDISKKLFQLEVIKSYNKTREYVDLLIKKEKDISLREVFNGDMVNELTGLAGKDLGDFIIRFKKTYSIANSKAKNILNILNFYEGKK